MKQYNELTDLFERANRSFLENECALLHSTVSERTLCGALMLHMRDQIIEDDSYDGYYVDVEYNRNRGKIKTICETVNGVDLHIVSVTCDLILHSRGQHPEQDNLIAIEMKKSSRPDSEKQKDRMRLIALTKDSFDDVWSFDGHTLPEHVCRYGLGVYYEINYRRKEILIEYYKQGGLSTSYTIPAKPFTGRDFQWPKC